MLGKRCYTLGWGSHAAQWQVRSTSGHIVFEAACRQEASAICTRLNRRFPRTRIHAKAVARRPAPIRCETSVLVRNLWSGILPAFG
ncbi:MAG TPA: hypothetical protein VGN12_10520 [Pirellulales bacterium]|jgi:hypothetical protein